MGVASVEERFEVRAPVRAGGMGTVFRALDRASGAMVALKLLPSVDPAAVVRFRREAVALAALDHPKIVRYVASGDSAELGCYLAMEWVEGEDLGTRLARTPLSVEDTLAIARQVAAALVHAHVHGVLHRDLKPANLICDAAGAVKVVDFGIARVDGATRITGVGHAIGTPGYMSPEQVRGDEALDARSDLFALGCVLYACLTGDSPFSGEDALGAMARVMFEAAADVRTHRAGVPAALAELIARLLAPAPADRPADAGEVLAALDAIVADGPAAAAAGEPAPIGRLERSHVSVMAVRDRAAAARSLALLRALAARHDAQLEPCGEDEIVAIFRATTTATDAAARAARCALALATHLPGAAIAIAAGPAVLASGRVGGETFERAMDLVAGGSASGGVRLDQASVGLLGSLFDVDEGANPPRLTGERSVDGARRLLGRAIACHGRERELRTLLGLYDDCVELPRAAVVLVTAAAGGGKTRLRFEVERSLRARADAPSVWAVFGDSMRAGSPFALLAELVRRAVGVREDEPLEAQRARLLERMRGRVGGEAERVAAFLGEIAGIPFSEDDIASLRAARRDARLMNEHVQRATDDWLRGEAAVGPVVLVLEDLHWGDWASVKVIDGVLRALADRPLLVMAFARPEIRQQFPRLWQERALEHHELRPLPPAACRRLVHEALGADARDELVSRLVERCAGNAFYLEELIRAAAAGQTRELPVSVVAMVQARLAALPDELRRTLRAASVFGEEVWSGGVAALLERSPEEAFDRLVAEEWLRPRAESRFRGERALGFSHALARDAAYASLTDADRALGHKRAAQWLERVGAQDPLMLAEHWERGGELTRASAWFVRAAQRALDGEDAASCLAHAERALACSPERATRQAALLLEAEAHNWRAAYPKANIAARAAVDAAIPGTPEWAHALHMEGWASQGNIARLQEIGELLAAEAERQPVDDTRFAIAISQCTGWLSLSSSVRSAQRLAAALEHRLTPRLASEPVVRCAKALILSMQWLAERPIDAIDGQTEAIHWAKACESLRYQGYGLSNRSFMRTEVGDFEGALEDSAEALALSARCGILYQVYFAQSNYGWALVRLGRVAEGRAQMLAVAEAAARREDEGDDDRSFVFNAIYLAEASRIEGDLARARAEAGVAIESAGSVPHALAYARGVLARVLLAQGHAAEALAAAETGFEHLGGELPEGGEYVWLVLAEALDACGRCDEARERLRAQVQRIRGKAARLDDRHRPLYLGRLEFVVRALELARAWGIEGK